jgi:hypothetical protein
MTVNGTGGGGAQYARTPVATFHLRHWGYTFLRRNGGVSGMPGAIMERATTSDADDSFSTNISSIINQVCNLGWAILILEIK